jgi:hypothetical protein
MDCADEPPSPGHHDEGARILAAANRQERAMKWWGLAIPLHYLRTQRTDPFPLDYNKDEVTRHGVELGAGVYRP